MQEVKLTTLEGQQLQHQSDLLAKTLVMEKLELGREEGEGDKVSL